MAQSRARSATASGGATTSRAVARVAGIALEPAQVQLLREAFGQYRIQLEPLAGDPLPRLEREKFEACVLPLNDAAGAFLTAIRKSRSNSRIVVYGISPSTRDALRFASYGVNAVFDQPLERQAVVRIVRATHLLVLNELRRYVRIPVVVEVTVRSPRLHLITSSREVSGGGMSLDAESAPPVGTELEACFALPGVAWQEVKSTVAWVRPAERSFGIRFDPADPGRIAVRQWIDDYLEF